MRPELKSWADRVIGRPTQFTLGPISRLWAQIYAAAVDDLNLLYFDEGYAKAHGHPGLVVPPNYLATLRGEQEFGPPDSELLEDGMAPSARPPLANLMGMGGGQKLIFHRHAYCGEHIEGQRTVTGVQEKEGRSGLLVIIEDELIYSAKDGECILTLCNTLLCRWIDGDEA